MHYELLTLVVCLDIVFFVFHILILEIFCSTFENIISCNEKGVCS